MHINTAHILYYYYYYYYLSYIHIHILYRSETVILETKIRFFRLNLDKTSLLRVEKMSGCKVLEVREARLQVRYILYV